jgi:cytochrome c553
VLKETIRSGKQAKIATGIAAAGIIMTFIISAATMYYNYQQRQAEAEHSQREIQVLRESSRESRAAADSHSQDEMRALSDILRALQNPNTTAPNNPRPKPKALFGKE